MLRAYRRPLVERMVASAGEPCFVPVLASRLARSAAEVAVSHAPRAEGRSRYGPARLLRLGLALLRTARPAAGPARRRPASRDVVVEVLE
jgi:undecaprenyl-phosphate 4-deoxy-4-formamido-L-arabinose transferase